MKKLWFALMVAGLIQSTAKAQDSVATLNAAMLYPLLYQQKAAEYRALCYQAFNAATMQVDHLKKRQIKKQHLALITDLDETILDNSYMDAQLVKTNQNYSPAFWKLWTDQSAATAVPGAVQFLQYAKQKGISVFYISNRNLNEVTSTLKNLQTLHLPDADTSHMLFANDSNSKEERRQKVAAHYKTIMLLGDNLNDFSDVFYNKNVDDRFAATDAARQNWGAKFIVLPNAVYGDWINALFNYQHLSPQQKIEVMLNTLQGFNVNH